MAHHARLAPPPALPRQEWPWHKAKWGTVSLADLRSGDRRLEAEAYLSSGYGLRVAIERKRKGWRQFAEFAHTWQPSRLKGIQVSPEEGTPFLSATQVFGIRPVPRKWLALEKTFGASERFVHRGQILVTCSGAVGRATLAYQPHEKTLITHDLLRVDARDPSQRGWVYAYLRAPQTRAMMSGAQYGHIIKHLETKHLDALPVPEVDSATAADFERRVVRLLDLRDRSYQKTLEAERLFKEALGPVMPAIGETGFVGRISDLATGRRRLEAAYRSPEATAILERIRAIDAFDTVDGVTERVWWMTRFKRYFGDGGIPYVSADELFSINPTGSKRILLSDEDKGKAEYRVWVCWIVMARSGQIYGLNGSAMLTTTQHKRQFISDDLIRIIPDASKIRPGYLLTALTHPTLGRPLVIRNTYGTSIPHLDPADVGAIPVVRFQKSVETAIADLAEASAQARADADELERELAEDAGRVIERFIADDKLSAMIIPVHTHEDSRRPAPLAEHTRVRLRKALPECHLRAGAAGTVVHLYRRGGLEVEFGAESNAPKVVTLDRDSVEPLAD